MSILSQLQDAFFQAYPTLIADLLSPDETRDFLRIRFYEIYATRVPQTKVASNHTRQIPLETGSTIYRKRFQSGRLEGAISTFKAQIGPPRAADRRLRLPPEHSTSPHQLTWNTELNQRYHQWLSDRHIDDASYAAPEVAELIGLPAPAIHPMFFVHVLLDKAEETDLQSALVRVHQAGELGKNILIQEVKCEERIGFRILQADDTLLAEIELSPSSLLELED